MPELKNYADMELVDNLLQTVDWKKAVISRHQKYIKEYLSCDSQFYELCKRLDANKNDLLRIFYRIQKQLIDGYERSITIKKESEFTGIPNFRNMTKLQQLKALVEYFPDWDRYVNDKQVALIKRVFELETDNWTIISQNVKVAKSTVYGILISEYNSALVKLKKRAMGEV